MDFYRHRLAHAGWTWRENKTGNRWIHGRSRRKDRLSGRAEKHRARALERRETQRELNEFVMWGRGPWPFMCCAECDW